MACTYDGSTQVTQWLKDGVSGQCEELGCKLFHLFVWCLGEFKKPTERSDKLKQALDQLLQNTNVDLLYLFVWSRRKDLAPNFENLLKEVNGGAGEGDESVDLNDVVLVDKLQPQPPKDQKPANTFSRTRCTLYQIQTTDNVTNITEIPKDNYLQIPTFIRNCLSYLNDVLSSNGEKHTTFTINPCTYNEDQCKNLNFQRRNQIFKALKSWLLWVGDKYRPYVSAYLGCCTDKEFQDKYVSKVNTLTLKDPTLTQEQLNELRGLTDIKRSNEDVLKQIGGLIQKAQTDSELKENVTNDKLRPVLQALNELLKAHKQFDKVPADEFYKQPDGKMDKKPEDIKVTDVPLPLNEIPNLKQTLTSMNDHRKVVSNFKEDVLGAVRVYVNVNAYKAKCKDSNDNDIPDTEDSTLGVGNEQNIVNEVLALRRTCESIKQPTTALTGKKFVQSGVKKKDVAPIPRSERPRLPLQKIKGGASTDKIVVLNDNSNIETFEVNKFSHVFKYREGRTNEDVYHEIKPLIAQVLDGYSVVMFGYGYSGSGKTYALTGKNETSTEGIMQLSLFDQEFLNKCNGIILFSAFELYHNNNIGDLNVWNLYNPKNAYNTNLQNTSRSPLVGGMCFNLVPKTVNEPFVVYDKSQNKLNKTQLEDFLQKTNQIRISKGRIKSTVNNGESSRSHLFLIFKVIISQNKEGYLTFVDMAGREDPMEILNSSLEFCKYQFDTLLSTNVDKSILHQTSQGNNGADKQGSLQFTDKTRLKANATTREKDETEEQQANRILAIVKEGFFINETINHLAWYFMKKNRKDIPFRLINIDFLKTIKPRPPLNSPNNFGKVVKYLEELNKQNINIDINEQWIPKGKYTSNTVAASTVISEIEKRKSKTIEFSDIYDPNDMVFNQPKMLEEVEKGTWQQYFTSSQNGSNIPTLINSMNRSCPMIVILDMLERLGGKGTITKFAMMCCVRREARYANDIIKTLQFAESISSNNFAAEPVDTLDAVQEMVNKGLASTPATSSGGAKQKMKRRHASATSKDGPRRVSSGRRDGTISRGDAVDNLDRHIRRRHESA